MNVLDTLCTPIDRVVQLVKKPFDPKHPLFRLNVLLGCCLLTFGSYYCYDIVGALSDTVIKEFYGVQEFQYSLLYSVYSLPNTVLPFFGGYFVDTVLGVRIGGVLFAGLVFTGQLVWAIGGFWPNHIGYTFAIIGRFIFGLGGESLSVTQSAYISKWFDNKGVIKIASAFGITLAFARIGSAINFIVTPIINSHLGTDYALWLGSIFCFVSMGAAIHLAITDFTAERIAKRDRRDAGTEEPEAEEKIKLKDVFSFKYPLWNLMLACVLFYISIFIFLQYASGFFQHQYGLSTDHASEIVSIPYLVAAVAAPTFGILVDIFGYKLHWLTTANITNAICMVVMLGIPQIPPAFVLLVVGASYSMVAASLWPCIPAIVEKQQEATAYGLYFAAQNAGLFITPLVLSALIGQLHQYTIAIGTFSWCALCAAMLTGSLVMSDFQQQDRDLKINVSSYESRQIEERRAKKREDARQANAGIGHGRIQTTGSVNDYGYPDTDQFLE